MMVVIFVSALWAALAPQRLFFKIPGYLLSFAAILEGLRLSWLLEEINVKSLYLLDLNEGCKALVASFPFGLPLARWLPAHFRPIGVCGVDSIWFFLGLSMTQWLIIVYLILLIGLSLMLASFLWQRFSFAAKDG
jgi:disulfide bond formation protein DsbB